MDIDTKELQNATLQQILDNNSQSLQDISSESTIQNLVEARNLEKYKFRAILNVYATKNNVSWVLTDVTGANIFFKKSGGMICKRGSDKNSSKTTLKNFEEVIEVVKTLKIDYLTFQLKSGFGTKKSPAITKSVFKLLSLFRDIDKYSDIVDSTTRAISKMRLKGGKRGRRV
jgi:ribosomal protein S11